MAPQRIHVLTFGSLGDVLPLAALAAELTRRGHEVTLWCARLHHAQVQRMGVQVRPLQIEGLPPLKVQANSVLKTPALWRRVEQTMQATYLALADEVAALPAGAPRPLLVASTFALAGRLAQEKLGLRLATVHLAPACMASLVDSPAVGSLSMPRWMPRALRPWICRTLERAVFDPVTTPGLNAFRAQIGLPPVRHVLTHWMHSPDAVLGFFPAWFATPQPDWPAATQVLDFPLEDGGHGHDLAQDDPALAAFLQAGPPPVVCYPGSAKRDARTFFAEALRACAAAGQRLIVLTRYPEEHLPGGAAALPPWALHRAYAPFAQLLPRSRALVHCGGVGTLAQALRAGCPQLLLPYTFDQFDNAHRLKVQGLAEVHHGLKWGAALHRLLNHPEVAAACRERQAHLPSGGEQVLARAAQVVEALALP